MDRRALFASGAAAALLAATGVSARSSPARGGRLRAALSGAVRGQVFDGREAHGLFMQVATVGLVFDTLTEIAADGTLRGELATVWRGSPDARNWVFDLRRGVSFHDGSPFSARDVAATFDLHRAGLLHDVEEIAVPCGHQLQMVLAQGDPDLPYRLSDPRLIVHPADNIAGSMEAGIGTGLYRVRRFQTGSHLLAQRVTSHYKDGFSGWFDEVELVAISADAVRAEALREHYVDVADLTHTADLGDLEQITTLPEKDFMTTAVDHCLALPSQIGTRWPLDNLRAAERWWMA